MSASIVIVCYVFLFFGEVARRFSLESVSLALYLNESLSVKDVYEANKRSLHVSGRSHTEVLLKAKVGRMGPAGENTNE
jgi:hypothetical protein